MNPISVYGKQLAWEDGGVELVGLVAEVWSSDPDWKKRNVVLGGSCDVWRAGIKSGEVRRGLWFFFPRVLVTSRSVRAL